MLFVVLLDPLCRPDSPWAEMHGAAVPLATSSLAATVMTALGVPEPWPAPASLRALALGLPATAAVADPVALNVGLDDVSLLPLAGGIDPADARQLSVPLIDAAKAHGVDVRFDGRLLGAVTAPGGLSFEAKSPADLAGASLRRESPRGTDGARLTGLMTEWQMLLHEHPANVARARRGVPPVGGLWLHGRGDELPPAPAMRLPTLCGQGAELKGLWDWLGGTTSDDDAAGSDLALIVDDDNAAALAERLHGTSGAVTVVFADGRLYRRRRRWFWQRR